MDQFRVKALLISEVLPLPTIPAVRTMERSAAGDPDVAFAVFHHAGNASECLTLDVLKPPHRPVGLTLRDPITSADPPGAVACGEYIVDDVLAVATGRFPCRP